MSQTLDIKQFAIFHNRPPAQESAHPPRRRKRAQNPTYGEIDKCLKEIAKSQPRSHEEVFKALDGRVPVPDCKPFRSAKGWWAGYDKRTDRARAWLSMRWGRLHLPPFRPGPKK
jgi:hypothetical protein